MRTPSDTENQSTPTDSGAEPSASQPAATPAPSAAERIAALNAEMQRTAYQKKAVSRLPANEVLDFAIAFFKERGYRSGRTGRPNQVFVMGPKEGNLPRVTGEVNARADVGKPGTTLVTLDAVGEKLGPTMGEFHKALRAQWQAARAKQKAESEAGADT